MCMIDTEYRDDYEAFCQSRGLRQKAMSEAQYADYLLNQEVAAHTEHLD